MKTHIPQRGSITKIAELLINKNRTYALLIASVIAMVFPFHLLAQESTSTVQPEALSEAKLRDSLAVIPEMVTVGDPGNAPDPSTGFGAVEESFQIGKYDVTVLQWATFLNAVHVTEGNLQDPRNLYHPEMFRAGSTTSLLTAVEKTNLFLPKNWGTEAGYYYATLPITGISKEDCKRYLNWLHHGAPAFDTLNEETLAITETGAYDFTNGKQGELMEGARYFLPTLDQWYKAAYYQAGTVSNHYWRYPTQSDQLPARVGIYALNNITSLKTGANFATIGSVWPYFKFYYKEASKGSSLTTPVGSFKDSPGPYGTYDMGGNIRQWTSHFVLTPTGAKDIAPGGSYDEASDALLSTNAEQTVETTSAPTIGLRVCASPATNTHLMNNGILAFEEILPKSPDFKAITSEATADLYQVSRAMFYDILPAQLTAYGLELLLNIAETRPATLAALAKSFAPFTPQRNLVNAILCVVAASSTSAEANNMNIKEMSDAKIAGIAACTVATLLLTESSGVMFEGIAGEVLKKAEENGLIRLSQTTQATDGAIVSGLKTSDGWTWQRLLVNIYYIGAGTYNTVASDLKYSKAQQKQQGKE